MSYNNEIEKAWLDAKNCNCGEIDCSLKTHRLCAKCENGKMLKGAHQIVENKKVENYKWHVNHINPNGANTRNNRQAIHVVCHPKNKIKK